MLTPILEPCHSKRGDPALPSPHVAPSCVNPFKKTEERDTLVLHNKSLAFLVQFRGPMRGRRGEGMGADHSLCAGFQGT